MVFKLNRNLMNEDGWAYKYKYGKREGAKTVIMDIEISLLCFNFFTNSFS